MKQLFLLLTYLILVYNVGYAVEKPWEHGHLKVSDNSMYISHEDGKPFFWLGDTGWLLPERLDRDEAAYYLQRAADAGFNVVQVQVVNDVPAFNAYGKMSMPNGFDFSGIDMEGEYGYWDHMDYIVDTAAKNGIYVGMVCIWGSLVKAGKMNAEEAKAYGAFLAERYKDCPNIVWIIGGDIQGDVATEVWDTLARTIKGIDRNHLMTFHPRGRHTSAQWFADCDWIDFHMFQSGHRRYNQRMGNKDYPIKEGTEEDSWMYVDSTRMHGPLKPVLDGEPSYEDIPQGLHGEDEPRWGAKDVRRYAYWSVFAGSCGHTYGHNAIMQFVRPGVAGAYFADGVAKPWYVALDDAGYNQMKHLKHLMLTFPYFERVADQSVVVDNGSRYERLAATRGSDYLLVYNHTGRPMDIFLDKIQGAEHDAWWMDAATGSLKYIGKSKDRIKYTPEGTSDGVLIVADSTAGYLRPDSPNIANPPIAAPKDLTE